MSYKNSECDSLVLGIDIGGTGIKAAPVDIQKGRLLHEPVYISTPDPPSHDSILEVLGNIVSNLNWKGSLGCGFPGVIKNGTVLTAPNLSEDWIGICFESEIRELVHNKVVVVNDADAAGIAEMEFGAGSEYKKHGGGVVLMITLGTGIGTALFVQGHLVYNTEFGHVEINGVEAEKRAATAVLDEEELNWEEWAQRVNEYLGIMNYLLSPDVFIIGGGVSENSEKFFPFLDIRARVLPAKMHNDAGIIGAALASHNYMEGNRQQLFRIPSLYI
jgi:polyphosphate glucokinase